jgi:hypothetical protein
MGPGGVGLILTSVLQTAKTISEVKFVNILKVLRETEPRSRDQVNLIWQYLHQKDSAV